MHKKHDHVNSGANQRSQTGYKGFRVPGAAIQDANNAGDHAKPFGRTEIAKVDRKAASDKAVREIATVRLTKIRQRIKETVGDRSRLEPCERI